ncbi:hypothetical protein C2845_PM07G10260 [Panicum miliaceum]|uniref:Uncharacterized protein n=1 Tax=Panicum miliaceum TaxID=4540 RepID=A0A3L6SSZ1_PANMI|nr:hypothetical protein C2845_PM07G10260 [Panicum miliaceum]
MKSAHHTLCDRSTGGNARYPQQRPGSRSINKSTAATSPRQPSPRQALPQRPTAPDPRGTAAQGTGATRHRLPIRPLPADLPPSAAAPACAGAMVLRFLFGTPAGDLGPRDSPPADSPSPTSQGGSGNGARADVARRAREVEYLLANLEKEGVEIDDKIASIIDDEVARIKAEAASCRRYWIPYWMTLAVPDLDVDRGADKVSGEEDELPVQAMKVFNQTYTLDMQYMVKPD